MGNEKTTVSVILYKSKTLANGEHPIMLRISKNKSRKYKALKISCSLKNWDPKINAPKRSHPNKHLIDAIITKAIAPFQEKILEFESEGKEYTTDVLVRQASRYTKKTTVNKFFLQKIAYLKQCKQVGNAKVYHDTFNVLTTFCKHDITFSQIDYNFLLRFEGYLKAKGLTDNGISLRFRTIRSIFNMAIAEGFAKKDNYPFSEFKISKRYNTATVKRAISHTDLKKIESLSLKKYSGDFEAQQYFLFSYYGKGINFVDLANLKWSNFIDGRIFYRRAKTGGEISFKLLGPALAIINHWRPADKMPPDDYIFPVLNKAIHKTPTQKHNRVHKVITRVNKSLKKIGAGLGISIPLTTYVARHTFATRLKFQGNSTAVISEALGHRSEAITQTYLKSFGDDVIDKAMEALL